MSTPQEFQRVTAELREAIARLEDRDAMAQAWDEGWEAAWSPMSMHSLNAGPNPYRTEGTR